MLRERNNVLDHALQLGRHLLQRNLLFFQRINLFRSTMKGNFINAFRAILALQHFTFRVVIRSRIRRLEQFKDLIIAHLDIGAARLFDHGRIRPFDHVFTVCLILNLQTDFEFGVAPNLIIDNPCRLLRGQNQMDAKASADPRRTHQLLHELRLILL
ncbi:hypothetical protein D3C77_329040 [compost metagenome]